MNPDRKQIAWFANHSEIEDDMETSPVLFMALFLNGLGTFFIGIGVLWWVSVLAKEKKE